VHAKWRCARKNERWWPQRKAAARKKLDEAKYPAEFKKSWRFTELLVTSENEQQQAHS